MCAILPNGSSSPLRAGWPEFMTALDRRSAKASSWQNAARPLVPPVRKHWVDRAFVESHDIKRWSGPRSLPMWVPLPDFAGFATRDTSPARESGLKVRAWSETARDTLLWSRPAGGSITGLTADEENAALKAWHARQHQRVD